MWKISKENVSRVNAIVARQKNNPIVLARKKRNLAGTRARVSKERFWRALVSCLLTTQQRSGPWQSGDALQPLHAVCVGLFRMRRRTRSPRVSVARGPISAFGGIRRAPTLATQIADNFKLLEGGLWPEVHREIERLTESKVATRTTEVEVANFINERLAGFGPKQARNLLQGLGLTRYEIPIDIRIFKGLRSSHFLGCSAQLAQRGMIISLTAGIVSSGVLSCVLMLLSSLVSSQIADTRRTARAVCVNAPDQSDGAPR